MTFAPVPEGTEMRWVWEVEPRGAFRLLAPLVGRIMGRRLDTVLSNIKRVLEAHQGNRISMFKPL